MTRLVVAFLALFSAMMALLFFLIIVLSTALLLFARGEKKKGQKMNPLMEPEKTAV